MANQCLSVLELAERIFPGLDGTCPSGVPWILINLPRAMAISDG